MLNLEARYFGITVGALLTAFGAVAIAIVVHLVLRAWIRRRMVAEAAPRAPAPSESPRLANWMAQSFHRSRGPLALVLWVQCLRFAAITVLADVPSSPAIIKAIQVCEWLGGIATLIGLAWLLSRLGKTLERILLSVSSRTRNNWDDVFAPLAGKAARLCCR